MKYFTLCVAACCGNRANCSYPNHVVVDSEETFRQAVTHDYVCAVYRNDYRNKDHFLSSDCVAMDVDNESSDDPETWVSPEMLHAMLPDIPMLVHFSRHHLKTKGDQGPRPRFHVLLAIDPCEDASEYTRLKRCLLDHFPFFDANAVDAARFFFGTTDPEVMAFDGHTTLNAWLEAQEQQEEDAFEKLSDPALVIPRGSRNNTLSRFAACVLKRCGDTEEALRQFESRAACCDPPLPSQELDTIWHSALTFFRMKISRDPAYVPPEQFTGNMFQYAPEDYTNVGQAELIGRFYTDQLRYSPATGYIHFDGSHWVESKTAAQAVAHDLTARQMKEAETLRKEVDDKLRQEDALMPEQKDRKNEAEMDPKRLGMLARKKKCENYLSYALQNRSSKNISAVLQEAKPVVEFDPSLMDHDPFLLCTPAGTVDLRQGMAGMRAHQPDDFLTHITSVAPGEKGRKLWEDSLNIFFCQDPDLISYVKRVAGIICIGQVFWETMIIAYGGGSNGKSTFFNVIARVLGSYSGNVSADALTVNCKRNVKPEMAEARGKRLLIASELEEGMRLNTSTVKQLTSTDQILGEKKYKDPLPFTPSHTLVLYTNHLPKVGASDHGIWRRLIVLPFLATIQGKSDIKNYADYLYREAGPAILSWMIEGAKEVIDLDYHLPLPDRVASATQEYREANNWLGQFLNDTCEIGNGLSARSGDLYSAYRAYCAENNEYTRSTTDFYTALEANGFTRKRNNRGNLVLGLSLIPRSGPSAQEEFPDFMN